MKYSAKQCRQNTTRSNSQLDLIQVPFSCGRFLYYMYPPPSICIVVPRAQQVGECRTSQNNSFLRLARDGDLSQVKFSMGGGICKLEINKQTITTLCNFHILISLCSCLKVQMKFTYTHHQKKTNKQTKRNQKKQIKT